MFGYALFVGLSLVATVKGLKPKCTEGSSQIIPKEDCKGFYMCVLGTAVEMPDCPEGTVFSQSAHVCAHHGSIYDDCKLVKEQEPLSIEEQCSLYGGLIPHSKACQLYYNCSVKYDHIPRYFEQHLMECPYPQFYDIETQKCENFDQVMCGARSETKDGCDYLTNKCKSAHCIPCNIRYPSCLGLTDGYHPHKERLWTPYYSICYKERNYGQERCSHDADGRVRMFHPEMKECVSLDLIPQEHGGTMPECLGKEDGYHLDDLGRCDRYHYCEGGQYVNTVRCGEEEVYDTVSNSCQPASTACGPCGNSSEC